jgi:hypothetical protein
MTFALRLFIFSVIVASVAAVWSHGVKAKVQQPWQFAPRSAAVRSVSAGTAVHSVLAYGIAESTMPRDKVVAIVTDPVVANGDTIIPMGAQLEGVVERIRKSGRTAEVVLQFSRVVINGQSTDIHSVPITTTATMIGDLQVLGDAFGVSAGALLGTAVGAASNNPGQIPRGAVLGGVAAVSVPVQPPSITVVVDRDVQVSWS